MSSTVSCTCWRCLLILFSKPYIESVLHKHPSAKIPTFTLTLLFLDKHPHFSTSTFGFTSMSCQLKVDCIFIGPIAPRSNKLHLTKLCNTRLLFWQAFLFQKTCISHIIAKQDRDLQHSTKCDDSTWKFSSIRFYLKICKAEGGIWSFVRRK